MINRKIVKSALLLLLIVISNFLIIRSANLEAQDIRLSFNVVSSNADTFQIFYCDGSAWTEENSQKIEYINVGKKQELEFYIPSNTIKLRFDIGSQVSDMIISDIKLFYYGRGIEFEYKRISEDPIQLNITKSDKNSIYITTSGNDPYFIYKIDNEISVLLNHKQNLNLYLKIALCITINILLYALIKKSKSVLILVQDLYNSKTLIWSLAKNDFKTKYAGSYLGIIWAFIQPVITILVYWFVFEFGLKAGSPTEGVPFILWFSAGLIPWFFFSDAINNAMNCYIEYSYLVKKVVFKISILPIVKIISSLFVHFAFIAFILILSSLYGFFPTIYLMQLIYYIFCTFFLVLALSYITSAVIPFLKDLGQIVNILLQIGMWATPIMWSNTIVPENFQWIVKINPMFYIVEGYRDTFINHIWFFEKYFQTIYFWIITLFIFALGALIFKKLKPHFADII